MTARLGRAGFVLVLGSLGSAGSIGCGGGLPLLHPAQTLPLGDIRVSGGLSGNFAVGGLSGAVKDATNEAAANPSVPGPAGADSTYARGALVVASVAPGISSIVGARIGIGGQTEGGLAYTGRAVRADLRRSFDLSRYWALSLGLGGSAALYGHQDEGTLPNVDLGQLHGWGADVPVLFGYQSDSDVYTLWLGARGGWEHVDISEVRSEDKAVALGTPPISLSATRFWGGAVLGLAVGFRHVHVAMELDASYMNVTGDYNATHAQVSGVTLSPASALWWRF